MKTRSRYPKKFPWHSIQYRKASFFTLHQITRNWGQFFFYVVFNIFPFSVHNFSRTICNSIETLPLLVLLISKSSTNTIICISDKNNQIFPRKFDAPSVSKHPWDSYAPNSFVTKTNVRLESSKCDIATSSAEIEWHAAIIFDAQCDNLIIQHSKIRSYYLSAFFGFLARFSETLQR